MVSEPQIEEINLEDIELANYNPRQISETDKEEIEKIKEENSNKVDTAINEKKENQIELANLETELERLKGVKQERENENSELQKKNSKIKLLKKVRKEINDDTILINNYDITDSEEEINKILARIKELEEKLNRNHYEDTTKKLGIEQEEKSEQR